RLHQLRPRYPSHTRAGLLLDLPYQYRTAGAVLLHHPLSIDTDFTGFGTDVADLRRQLNQRGATLHGSAYTQYGKALRRGLGIPGEQALELFHQTVSMKAVALLDEFVRERRC
ncbi:hypothetical protein ABPY43_12515, partial [Streptomyces sp. Mo3]